MEELSTVCQGQQHNMFNLFPFYSKMWCLYWQQAEMVVETDSMESCKNFTYWCSCGPLTMQSRKIKKDEINSKGNLIKFFKSLTEDVGIQTCAKQFFKTKG